jgi:hypothetical protein
VEEFRFNLFWLFQNQWLIPEVILKLQPECLWWAQDLNFNEL